ncbi:MAG: hypothetical protein ACXWLM_08025 [Myxococcales bacterium]
MGEGTTRVEVPEKDPRQIEREIDHLRVRLDRSLAELDRRRHELVDVRLQMKRHPRVFVGAGVFVALVMGGVAFAVWRAHERDRPVAKVHRLRIAFGRAVEEPHKVARGDAPVWQKILAAVGTTLEVSVTKKLLDRAWNALPA